MPKIFSDLRGRLLEEVERLLTQGGYGAVTIRAVAAGCGVAVGTVYNYFPGKEAMVAQLLLKDWRECMDAIQRTGRESETAKPVAACIHRELTGFLQRHGAVFSDEGAKGAFAGSQGSYHAMLRSQLAGPLAPFCESAFAGEFVAEALLTWTVAGKEFDEIWGLLRSLVQ